MTDLCKNTGIHNLFANPKDNFMFSIICKNACTYIKYITLLNNKINVNKINDNNFYHNLFIYNNLAYHPINMPYNIEPKNYQYSNRFNPDDYIMIYIYRDPFERFVSTYNDKIKLHLWPEYHNSGLQYNSTFEEFLDFSELNINTSIGHVEEHIRPQIDYYTTKVDYIIPIHKLGKFIKEFDISTEYSLIHSFPHQLDEYEKFREKVYKLYEKDLNILNILKNKIYT